MKHRPLRIGVSARLLHHPPRELGFRGKTLQYLEQSAAHWVMSHGAMAFMIPTLLAQTPQRRSMVTAAHYAENLDGLLLQGGADVDPRSYGEEPLRPEWAGDRVRDRYELSLLRAFIEQGKPVLGICRGMQLINVAYGGTLYQDIAEHLPGSELHHDAALYDELIHEVRFVRGSLFADIFGTLGPAAVTSIHHQGVRRLGDGLVAHAHGAKDGLIEAIVADAPNLVIGVQWHPEFHPSAGSQVLDCGPLLEVFMQAAQDSRRGSRAGRGDPSSRGSGRAPR
jgi:putative glutamine amidotransferase